MPSLQSSLDNTKQDSFNFDDIDDEFVDINELVTELDMIADLADDCFQECAPPDKEEPKNTFIYNCSQNFVINKLKSVDLGTINSFSLSKFRKKPKKAASSIFSVFDIDQ